ncbi:phosphoenolpyruvate--protein phosphotransferase [Sphingomonas sp. RIT328]|uniref:phosphoenolpyruvate--protein phosphotransferase n=1 Tax=Sphingomonas sp. RIT328 TaxID=1470591 RepID=UPI0004534944|nr:phosphoenolpyruvate--protein phosphotransferase [Sphingomonas sp. RIT328]EZP57232.1 Phosphoenolpyruvate-protein phosphotransferase [Sphingomonas sp. RIT328]
MTDKQLLAPLAGWVLPLTAVPDPVFAEGMMGPGVAIDPTGDTLHAPCDARVLTLHAAGHAITLDLGDGVSLLVHIGIDTVRLGGSAFTPLVAPGDSVCAGDALIRFDLDAIVRQAASAVTPVLLVEGAATIAPIVGEGLIAVGAPLARISAATAEGGLADAAAGETLRRDATVLLPHGLHARPAARIVAAVRDSGAEVTLTAGDDSASATSPIALLSLGLAQGRAVTITARGGDAAGAIDAVVALLSAEVDAPPPAVAPPPAAAPSLEPGALPGVPAAPGVAIGRAVWLRPDIPELPTTGEGVTIERARLAEGIAAVTADLAATAGGGQIGGVLAAHRAILDDPDLRGRAEAGIANGMAAAAAMMTAAEAQGAQLRATGNARIAERADDIRDVALRVVHAILGTRAAAVSVPAGAIVLADDLLPSQFAALAAAQVAGFAVVGGGPTSHVAMLAAGLGVPMVVAAGDALRVISDGTMLILDADAGAVVADPAPDRIAQAQTVIDRRAAAEAAARAAGDAPAATADGTAIHVYANLGSIADAEAAAAAGAEGCGLLRTEILFLDRAVAPDVAEQAADYRGVVAALPGRPVVIRLLDVGGDKPAPYLAIPPEENPALGLRGIRVSLARPEVLDTQLRAILAVPEIDRVRIMVPMVASVAELIAVRAALDRLRDELGIDPVPLGAMVETPAAAATADLIAAHADFLSIGSNDLTQYVLAMDRGNPAVASGIDGLHPAVLRLIGMTCDGAATRGVPVSVCGGLAADPLAAPILIGLGVRTLSVPPARVPATKALVGRLTLAAVRTHAAAATAAAGAAEVRALARQFAEEISR